MSINYQAKSSMKKTAPMVLSVCIFGLLFSCKTTRSGISTKLKEQHEYSELSKNNVQVCPKGGFGGGQLDEAIFNYYIMPNVRGADFLSALPKTFTNIFGEAAIDIASVCTAGPIAMDVRPIFDHYKENVLVTFVSEQPNNELWTVEKINGIIRVNLNATENLWQGADLKKEYLAIWNQIVALTWR